MEFYIYNTNFKRIGVIEKLTDYRINNKLNDLDILDIYCDKTINNINNIKTDNIVVKNNKAYFIEHIKINNVINLKCKSVKAYLNRRIILEDINYEGSITDIIMQLLLDNITNVNDTRRINNIKVNTLIDGEESVTESFKMGQNLGEIILNLCKKNNIIFDDEFDIKNNTIIFTFKLSDDKTNKCLFSKKLNNINATEITYSTNNFINSVLVKNKNNDETITINRNDDMGIMLYEDYVESTDTIELDSDLEKIGQDYLKEREYIESIEVNVKNNILKINKDYNIGDLVKFTDVESNIINKTLIVNEYEEIYSNDKLNICIVLGNSVPTITDKIKQELKRR